MMRQSLIYALSFSLGIGFGFATDPVASVSDLPRIPPTEIDEVLDSFEIREGFEIQLAAHEPLVVDPIAMAFDELGRLFVLEMRGYSERRDEALGRVRLLTDSNGDGTFDRSSVYLDQLKWPTALLCYKGGIFVGATPELLYAKDEDQDGVADTRRVVFTGFGAGRELRLNMQALFNSLRWGPDNRIWGATAANGGLVRKPEDPSFGEVRLAGADFSFDPEKLDLRPENGTAQYGLTFDSAGRRYVCSNSRHILWVAWERHWTRANRYFSLPPALTNIATDGAAAPVFRSSPDEPWRVVRTRWRVAGVVKGPVEGGGRVSGYFTSATGVHAYWGDAFGSKYRDDIFVGDVGSNLVHRKTVSTPSGMSQPIATRAADETESEFLRSVDNWFRPVSFATGPDGCLYICDMYREVIEHPWSLPEGIKQFLDLNSGNDRGRIYRIQPRNFQRKPISTLINASNEELKKLASHPNDWHQTTARRLLYERGIPAPAKVLPNQFSKDLSSEVALTSDIEKISGDPWKRAAVLNSLHHAADMAQAWGISQNEPGDHTAFRSELAKMIGRTGNLTLIETTISETAAKWPEESSLSILQQMRDGASRSGLWSKIQVTEPWQQLIQRSKNLAAEKEVPPSTRLAAIETLSLDGGNAHASLLQKICIDPALDPSLRLAAAQAHPDTSMLLKNFSQLPPSAQKEAVTRASTSNKHSLELIAWIKSGDISPKQIPVDIQSQFRNHSSAQIREQSNAAFGEIEKRSDVVAAYRSALQLAGDKKRGEEIFATHCSGCHKSASGQGYELGPSMQTYRTAGPDSILTNILDPNKEVAPQFQAYQFELRDGQLYLGIISQENQTEITILLPGGIKKKFPRSEVASMKGLGQSLMPEGLEQTLTKAAIADLIAYIRDE